MCGLVYFLVVVDYFVSDCVVYVLEAEPLALVDDLLFDYFALNIFTHLYNYDTLILYEWFSTGILYDQNHVVKTRKYSKVSQIIYGAAINDDYSSIATFWVECIGIYFRKRFVFAWYLCFIEAVKTQEAVVLVSLIMICARNSSFKPQ